MSELFESKLKVGDSDKHIYFICNKKAAADCCVSISFPANISFCVLEKLKSGSCACPMDCFPKYTEETCLCYAMFMHVDKFTRQNPVIESKTKMSSLMCGAQATGANSSSFFINWNIKGTLSFAVRTVALVLKAMQPAKVKPIYTNLVKYIKGEQTLTHVPNDDNYSYVVNQTVKNMKDMCIGVIGSVALTQEKFDIIIDKLKALPQPEKAGSAGLAPNKHIECTHKRFVVKTNGWEAFALKVFLVSKINGLMCCNFDGGLALSVNEARWETIRHKYTAADAKEFTTRAFSKLNDEKLECAFPYLAVSRGDIGADEAYAAYKKVSEETIKAAIVAGLK